MSDTEHFSYAISLRIQHPAIDPAEITRELRMQPTGSWAAGSQRRTPAGTLLEGMRSETYWYVRLLAPSQEATPQPFLERAMAEIVARLGAFKDFFGRVNMEGGRIVIAIGAYGVHSYGFEFSPSLHQQIGALGAAVLVEVFRDPQNW